MMDVILRYLWMLAALINQGMIDNVPDPDQEVVEAGVGADLPLDPGLGTASAGLHPDPGHVTVSADPAPEEGIRSQPLAAAASPKDLLTAAVGPKQLTTSSRYSQLKVK